VRQPKQSAIWWQGICLLYFIIHSLQRWSFPRAHYLFAFPLHWSDFFTLVNLQSLQPSVIYLSTYVIICILPTFIVREPHFSLPNFILPTAIFQRFTLDFANSLLPLSPAVHSQIPVQSCKFFTIFSTFDSAIWSICLLAPRHTIEHVESCPLATCNTIDLPIYLITSTFSPTFHANFVLDLAVFILWFCLFYAYPESAFTLLIAAHP